MQLTGYPSDFVVDASLPSAMVRFVGRARRRWPGLFLDGAFLTQGGWQEWRLSEPQGDGSPGVVTFSAGQAMEDFWEENGYALDASGQGPYAVLYRPNPQSPQRTGYLVSVVTPGHPDTDPFSVNVVRDFLESFEAARPGAIRHA